MICKKVHEEDKALHLLHSIYGLVQAARQYLLNLRISLRRLVLRVVTLILV